MFVIRVTNKQSRELSVVGFFAIIRSPLDCWGSRLVGKLRNYNALKLRSTVVLLFQFLLRGLRSTVSCTRNLLDVTYWRLVLCLTSSTILLSTILRRAWSPKRTKIEEFTILILCVECWHDYSDNVNCWVTYTNIMVIGWGADFPIKCSISKVLFPLLYRHKLPRR